MKFIVCFVLMITLVFCLSTWETRHFELTDNGFMGVATFDSMIRNLCGVMDNVGAIIYKTIDGGNSWTNS